MSLSTSWTCQQSSIPQPTHPAPSTTLRSIHKMSGLFDTGFTDEAGFSSVGNQAGFDELKTLNASDIFTALEKGDDFPNFDNTLSLDNEDPDFLEVFTDLSEFLLSGDSGDFIMTPDEAKVNPTIELEDVVDMETTVPKGNKRTASDAFQPTANTDHDDYTFKRPRLSSEESTTSMESSTNKSKEEKYRERRDKNNVASRRSRETRKQKFSLMEQQAVELEIKNETLRKKLEELEKLTKHMKEILVKRLATGQ